LRERVVELSCDLRLSEKYKSPSQIARVLSEGWFEKNAYCLACDADELKKTRANTKHTDFICPKCSHRYELKSFKRREPKSIPDGAFQPMIQSIHSGTAPTLCLLQRTHDWHIEALTAIHSTFLLPPAIVERKPLRQEARRADWIGCQIRLDRIDRTADIDVVENGAELPVKAVRERFQGFMHLTKESVEQRGWTLLTLRMVRSLGKDDFSSSKDLYPLEREFAKAYPNNRHIKDKIRQQLQMLCSCRVLERTSRGNYKVIG
jgi:type II restriction enzyme